MPEFNPIEVSEGFREDLKLIEARARAYVDQLKRSPEGLLFDKGEVIADAMLALRHLEDARMRYGKCIQYATTGESSYQR